MTEFRRVLNECLGRIRQGDSVQACLDANADHAVQLQPYLASAAALRGLRVAEPEHGKAVARQRLMQSVAAGTGKGEAVFGVMKFAHVVGAVVGAFLLMSVGLVAASGGPGAIGLHFGGGGDDSAPSVVELKGEVLNVDDDSLVLARDEQEIVLVITDETVFKDRDGHAIDGVEKGDVVIVRAEKDGERFVAIKVRIANTETVTQPEPTEAPKPKATPTPTPKPDATPVPTEKPVYEEAPPPPAAPKPAEAVFEGYVKEVGHDTLLLKKGDGTKITIHYTAGTVIQGHLSPGSTVRVEALVYPDGAIVATHIKVSAAATEFWGVVVSIGSGQMVLNAEFGQAMVKYGLNTQWSGEPFPGVKVIVKAEKNADGTYSASQITVMTAEFSGPVTWLNAGAMGVNAWDSTLTVKWNGATAWQGPDPHVGGYVAVIAYKMGDGTFLAKKIAVKSESFTGTVVSHSPGEFTIQVQVEAQVREVCYEFADVIGTLAVGKLVKVEVDHVEGSTYFASLVKVLS